MLFNPIVLFVGTDTENVKPPQVPAGSSTRPPRQLVPALPAAIPINAITPPMPESAPWRPRTMHQWLT